MPKEPIKIGYPNTRKHRASYGMNGPQSDLSAIGGQHYENIQKRLNEANEKELNGTGWKVSVGRLEPFSIIYNHEPSGYSYEPMTKNFYKGKKGNKQPDVPPEIDFSDLKEQKRLGDLAYASDEFGRDLYHDAAYRSGEEKIPYGKFENRPGYEYRSYSDEDLYNELEELSTKYRGYFWADGERNKVEEELARRRRERGE